MTHCCGDHIVIVDECCNQVVVRGPKHLNHQQYLVLLTPLYYPSGTLYLKKISDGDNIRYKHNPCCDFPCNTISLAW